MILWEKKMFKVKKFFNIPVGHRLSKHLGRCQFIHGHNLKIEVEVMSENLDKNDMVIDFSILKEIVHEIIDDWDHGFLMNSSDSAYDNLKSLSFCNRRLILLDNSDPTAEVISKYLYEEIDKELPDGIFMKSITVWESDTACAIYEP